MVSMLKSLSMPSISDPPLEEFSPVALRAPSKTSLSGESETDGIDEDFNIVTMSGSYLVA